MTISQQIRKIRRSMDLTQEEVAKRIGMPTCNYSHKEKNDKFTRENLKVICEKLNLQILIKEK